MSETEQGVTSPVHRPEINGPAPKQGAEGDDDNPDASANREAAKYRRALRSAEAERDGLRGQVQSMQRCEVERLAAASGVAMPSSIWGTTDLGSVLDPDGSVDPALARQAIERAVETLGLRVRTPMHPDMSQGARGTVSSQPDSWASLFASKE